MLSRNHAAIHLALKSRKLLAVDIIVESTGSSSICAVQVVLAIFHWLMAGHLFI